MALTADARWFAVAAAQTVSATFAARTPGWQRRLEHALLTTLATVSATFGRAWFFALLGFLTLVVLSLAALLLHALQGVDGPTGEPKAECEVLRDLQVEDR